MKKNVSFGEMYKVNLKVFVGVSLGSLWAWKIKSLSGGTFSIRYKKKQNGNEWKA